MKIAKAMMKIRKKKHTHKLVNTQSERCRIALKLK